MQGRNKFTDTEDGHVSTVKKGEGGRTGRGALTYIHYHV